MSEINIYVCTVLCRNQKWEMKIIIYGKTNKQTKQPANSIRITLLGGALWKKTICFNNWSQPNHKSSLLNHDLIFKIKEPKQQFLWPPPPSFLLLVALFFMNSSSHLFLVVASQTRKSGQHLSFILVTSAITAQVQNYEQWKSYPSLCSYNARMHLHGKALQRKKISTAVPLAPPQRWDCFMVDTKSQTQSSPKTIPITQMNSFLWFYTECFYVCCYFCLSVFEPCLLF